MLGVGLQPPKIRFFTLLFILYYLKMIFTPYLIKLMDCENLEQLKAVYCELLLDEKLTNKQKDTLQNVYVEKSKFIVEHLK